MSETKKGVLVMAFGAVEDLDKIEPFVKNIIRGREVSPELVEATKKRYELIGGKSPLVEITRDQAEAIEGELRKKGHDIKVYLGMRYWHPYIKEAVGEMAEDGVEGALGVVMAPFQSPVATGGYEKAVKDALEELDADIRFLYVSNWHINPTFVDLVAEKIKARLAEFDDPEDALVIFSNHSLPLEMLEGDAYEMKIHQTVDEILKRLQVDYRIAYQSKGGGGLVWLGPSTEQAMEEARTMGKKGVVVVPLGFVSDHVETLYDIDIAQREHAEKLGLVFKRSESLNTSPEFTGLLAELVEKQLTSL